MVISRRVSNNESSSHFVWTGLAVDADAATDRLLVSNMPTYLNMGVVTRWSLFGFRHSHTRRLHFFTLLPNYVRVLLQSPSQRGGPAIAYSRTR